MDLWANKKWSKLLFYSTHSLKTKIQILSNIRYSDFFFMCISGTSVGPGFGELFYNLNKAGFEF